MYKDPDRQREANRVASKRRRERINKECEGMTANLKKTLDNVIPDHPVPVIPNKLNLMADVINQQMGKPERTAKRGKDIKVFNDLPADVQETIAMMSRRDGKIDPIIKANRTAIAVNYQHQFPARFHSTGVN